ncbi:DUF1631 family protein [Stenotrophomonas sp. 24(2023)]|uniref:DUF1631 family protein n=1 Tax=Stenotrophomonas sp. 24(2023) TaxID=3068324 RepID=UPI0027E09EF1|nr:DUF1631 family protein [Stenotrophomonas sp. 24(2023)]WMJ70368.1 DUF1631 family protein [Stenotrophomonas sp. 24(2023)]
MSVPMPLLPADAARLDHSGLPPRVRQLLGQLTVLVRHTLSAPLALSGEAMEQSLLQDAELARSPAQQADLMGYRHQAHAFALPFGERMLDAVVEALANLRGPRVAAPLAAPQPATGSLTTLRLVDEHDIDRDIVLVEMVRRETLRSGNGLNLLGQRLGVLAAGPAFDAETLPLGPHALCALARRLAEQARLDPPVQLALFRSLDRHVLERLGEIIERFNGLLSQEGVLPGLVYTPYLARSASTRRLITHSVAGGRATRTSSSTAAPLTGWGGSAPAGSWSGMLQDAARPLQGFGETAQPAMATLHQLLANPASTPGPLPPGTAAPPTLPSAVLDGLLARLQAQASAPRSMADLQAALLAQLQRERPEAPPALAVKDQDTFDLLGRLFGQVQQLQRPDAGNAGLLARLQVPVARAALADPGFFVRDEHPARDLLNSVAEAGAVWLGSDDVDPQLMQRLAQSVERVQAGDTQDPAVFAAANDDIQQQVRAAAHRAELAERRHVDAARGREKLDVARRQTEASIAERCEQAQPPRFVQTLLRQAWADVMTLAQLRHGEDSPQWQQCLAQTARIAEVTAHAPGSAPADATLATGIEAALVQVGYHADEATAVARRLSTPGGEDDSTSRTELSARLKQRARLGGQAGDATPAATTPPARDATQDACYRDLLALPFGSWFEFTQDGAPRRLRLSWYSRLTDHALFVNARGQKALETQLDTLARQMADGQVRVVTEDKARLIDRAWQATLGALRTLAGPHPEQQA